MPILKREQKFRKSFFSKITAFELVAVNSHYYEENTCHLHVLANSREISNRTERDIF